MAKTKSICVFCGASAGRTPAYQAAAETLGAALAHAGIRLVYGGGSIGLMGAVAKTVIAHGGQVTGIIPEFLVEREKMLEGDHELIITRDMHERKSLMFDHSDAFIALPGGIGTLEELVEQLTWAQLGRHKKPILLADIDGFWAPLETLLQHMSAEAFIREGFEVNYLIATQAQDIVPKIVTAVDLLTEEDLSRHAKDLGDL